MKTFPTVEGLELRYTREEDLILIEQWLLEPGVLKAFPMDDEREVKDAAKYWVGFAKYKASITALFEKEPCGIATLCLMPYKKIAHQCLISILVSEKMRGKGVGTVLLNNLIHIAKNYFNLEVLYLEVYEGNPAIALYRRFGFKEVGEQPCFMKEDGKYVSKIIMERIL